MKIMILAPVAVVCVFGFDSTDIDSEDDGSEEETYTVSSSYALHRSILAFGYGYYKTVLHIGYCKDILLFTENKVWSAVTFNRILDIYYKSSDPDAVVSRAEVTLVGHGTNNVGYSSSGVGGVEFTGAIVFCTAERLTFYKLDIYSCDGSSSSHERVGEDLEDRGDPEDREPKTDVVEPGHAGQPSENKGLTVFSERDGSDSDDSDST